VLVSKIRKIVILGGTAEASALAREAIAALPENVEVISSLAGRTPQPSSLPGRLRVGGFGGGRGLADFIRAEGVNLLIDATHPFAEKISDHAHDACLIVGIPRLMLIRPPWQLPPSGRWIEVQDMAAAAAAVVTFSKRVFLTTGTHQLTAFSGHNDLWVLVRLIHQPKVPPPLINHQVVIGRPPFDLASESALLAEFKIDALVTKHSGGALPAKITAALETATPIILIERPPPPPGNRADNVADCLAWIQNQI